MTDLERQWEDLPVGPVPIEAILREGRASARPRRAPSRRLARSLLPVGVLAALGGAFLAGTLVTQSSVPGDPGTTLPGEEALPVPASFQGELQAPGSCEELLAHYVDTAVDLVGPYGWAYGYGYGLDAPTQVSKDLLSESPTDSAARGDRATTEASVSSDTGTNVQEAGVDEPDVVKTDSDLLVRLRGAELTTYDVSGEEVDELGSVDLGDLTDGEILLAGDTVVAIGNDGTRPEPGSPYLDLAIAPPVRQTRVLTIDVSDPSAPAVQDTVDYDAALVTARQHGDDVRLVLSSGLPDLEFVQPRRGRSVRAAANANQRLVRDSTLDDWLPHVSTGGGSAEDLLDCADVAIPRADLPLGTMAVVGFGADDPAGPAAPSTGGSLGLAGDASLAYESPDHLYLASSTDGGTTHVYDFALDGTGASYAGAGEVEGTVRDRWAMDEHEGVLRLAVGPTQETGSFNSVVLLGAQGDGLEEIGRVDRIGPGEDIKAVRWFDGLALVVTFRQVDPLYAVDLTDQAAPRLLGELKIPGFSEYLHPLGPSRMIGLGQGPMTRGGWGAQAGLFDVSDLTAPRRIDVVDYPPGSSALAGTDPRQFTWLPEARTALTVIERYGARRVGSVSALRVVDGQLLERSVQVEYGADVDQVRLVPLSDERVVLVTGEDVEFFAVEGP